MDGTSLAVRQAAGKPARARGNARPGIKKVHAAQRALHLWLGGNTSATQACVQAGLAQIAQMQHVLARRMPDANGDVVQEIPHDDLASVLRRADSVLAMTENIAAQVRRATADIQELTLALAGPLTSETPASCLRPDLPPK